MKRLITVRCEDKDREAIKAIARGDTSASIVSTGKPARSKSEVDKGFDEAVNCGPELDRLSKINTGLAEENGFLKGKLDAYLENPEGESAAHWRFMYDKVALSLAKYESDGSS